MNKYLISKLKEGRIGKGLKQSDVTKYTGIKNTTLSNYENGITEPDIDTFLQLCELYELNYADILAEAYGLGVQGQDFKIKPSEIEYIKKYRNLDDFGKQHIDYELNRETKRMEEIWEKKGHIDKFKTKEQEISKKLKPLRVYTYFGKIACAGSGFYFDDIPTKTVEVPDMGGDFIIGVNGDSMEPDYHDGDMLYVTKTDYISHGDIGIFTIRNECFLKEYSENELISRNKNYNNIPGTEDVRLIGKVIGKVGEQREHINR